MPFGQILNGPKYERLSHFRVLIIANNTLDNGRTNVGTMKLNEKCYSFINLFHDSEYTAITSHIKIFKLKSFGPDRDFFLFS